MVVSTESQISFIAAAQASNQPLCVYGPPGCGKSRLINLAWSNTYPAKTFDLYGPVSVNLDDSVDTKSLVGTFRSSLTDVGRFEWVDGLLVEVIKTGRWLVLEDVDRLNSDILSILPRQGDTHFRIPETNSLVEIHPDFGLIGTSTNSKRLTSTLSNWLLLECGYPKDLLAILNTQLPCLVSELVLGCYSLLIKEQKNSHQTERKFGLHDLFRVVSRVKAQLADIKITESTVYITDYQKMQIGNQFIDIFAIHSPFPARRLELVDLIETFLGCGSIGSDSCPAFSCEESSISIGEIRMNRRKPIPPGYLVQSFTLTSVHLRMLQRISRCLVAREGILIVGDTGVGKTTTVQFLAREMGVHMHVYNFSDQTEGSDLIGGLKPVVELDKLVAECEHLIRTTMPESSRKSGLAVLEYIRSKTEKRDYSAVTKSIEKTGHRAIALLESAGDVQMQSVMLWKQLVSKCLSSGKIFKFIEGPLVTAVRNGDWILLDEINLAPADVLRLLNGLLENGKLVIPETGEQVKVHPDFRLIAAMNPPHLGKGKRSLTDSLRSRLTELYCEEVTERVDLIKIVQQSLERDLTISTMQTVVPKIVDLYISLKTETSSQLSSLEGGPPVFSLRSLSRALEFAKRLLRSPKRTIQAGDGTRELIDGLKVSLTSAIDARSEAIVLKQIDGAFSSLSPRVQVSGNLEYTEDGSWVRVQGHWIACGEEPVDEKGPTFILTDSVNRNLKKLTICLAGGKLSRPPILCEGSTGAGKTSLVTYLARMSRHKLVRINNHEHTDLQDYFGQYVSQQDGSLVFQEGPLVTAVRHGHWVLLDELNLAPSEVLEALNRLLDDNRELIVPETNEVVKAHPDFVLFASQNPVSLEYSGRKSLSRAFRNRFIDVQIDELPPNELGVILAAKCTLADSTSSRMLATYTELSRLRRLDRVLSGRDSALVTVRDLLRWGMRHPTTREEIALEGYLVLGERLRSWDQKALVIKVLEEKVGVKNLEGIVHQFYLDESSAIYENFNIADFGFVRTKSLDRMLALTSRAIKAGESILAVGETGTGKTSAIQLVAQLFDQHLRIINCHQHLESSDLLGAVCPVSNGQLAWKDGPLIESCRSGGWLLLDEVNLADDSVIERLNSLLDVDYRAITLAEKPREETVVADSKFRLLCTMNPGNDFGKKELSAALRNRFTEIWVDSVSFEVIPESTGFSMIYSMLKLEEESERQRIAEILCECMHFVISQIPSLNVSTRDAILWCNFINSASTSGRFDSLDQAVVHGASLVLLDGLDDLSWDHSQLISWLQDRFGVTATVVDWIQEGLKMISQKNLQFGPFPLPPTCSFETGRFSLNAPTSAYNFGRLIRGMFAGRRPILLHGDPGAGKSSVVAALAKFFGVNLVRINLSDQTELADILGQNVPVGKSFVWKDGILLEAIARGDWVLLDELNLAPQPVLEGLNALLDHRAEIYVPAIDRLVKCPSTFRLFATQNEAKKGDGRKMLPRSFLSRFNRIMVKAMTLADLAVAAKESMLGNESVVDSAIRMISQLSGLGDFDWNLRDISRLLKCVQSSPFSAEIAWIVLGSRISDPEKHKTAKSIISSNFGLSAESLDWIDPSKYIDDLSRVSRVDLIASQSAAVAGMSLALRSGCHGILTGDSGVGKRSVIRLVSGLENQSVVEIRMHSQMDTSDLIGQFTQQIGNASSTEFKWMDSPLTNAVRNGGWVLLTNAHRCPPAILDRLNALIEDGGVLVIPEKGEAEVVHPHSNFRLILATEKPGLLSHAIRNRCIEIHLSSSELTLFDKVRIGTRAGRIETTDIWAIANTCGSARHVFQAASLVSVGLSLDESTWFVAGQNPMPISPSSESVVSGTVLERQLAVARETGCLAWFLESAEDGSDLLTRLRMAHVPVPTIPDSVITTCWSDAEKRRLVVHLILKGVNFNSTEKSGLHSIDRNNISKSIPEAETCFDDLLQESIEVSKSTPNCLVFSGALRLQSEELMNGLLRLIRIRTVPVSAVVELAASAIALRGRSEELSVSNEAKILSTIQALVQKYSLEDDQIEDVIVDPIRSNIETVLRLCGVVDMAVLLKCEARITESDLIMSGVERAAEWLGLDISKERIYTMLWNLIQKEILQTGVSKSAAVFNAIEAAKSVSCGDLTSIIEQLRLVHDCLGKESDSLPVHQDISLLVQQVLECNILDRSSDLHSDKTRAVEDIRKERESLTSESVKKRFCRDVSSLGVDDSANRTWDAKLSHVQDALVQTGIFIRPSGDLQYQKLAYLFGQVKSTLAEAQASKALISHQCVMVIASFIRTVSSEEYRFYRDLTRPVCLVLLELVYGISNKLIEQNRPSQIALPLPVVKESISNPLQFVEWMNIESGNGLKNLESTRSILRNRIDTTIATLVKSKEQIDEDGEQVIIQGDVEISIANLVQDNDKANADAAVNRLRKQLFPDTSSKFIQSLKATGEDSFYLVDDPEDQETPEEIISDSDLDKLAMALVASNDALSLKKFLCSLLSADMSVHDFPEVVALNRLRIDSFIEDAVGTASTKFSSEDTEEETLQEEEEIIKDNREMKLKLSDFIRDGRSINFYSPGGGREAIGLLSKPFVKVTNLLAHLETISEISDHPDLVHAIAVVKKALTLRTDCSANCALQTAEYVLTCVEKLDKSIPSRYLNSSEHAGRFTAVVAALIAVIARLRASEIASWKDLRLIRETLISKSGAGKWFVHLWNSATDPSSFDTLLAWLRNSGCGQFSFRLGLIESVASVTGSSVMKHVVSLGKIWEKSINSKIRIARRELDKQVKALTKEIRFRLGGRHYSNEMFRIDTKRSHNQLAAVLKRFEESISQPVQEILSSAGSLLSAVPASLSASSLSTLVAETIETIRNAPSDKTSKALKQRLLSDVTMEVRELIKSLLSVSSIGMKEFTAQFVIERMIVSSTESSHSSALLLSRCMKVSNMQPICKNQDVKPSTILEWRSLTAHIIEVFAMVREKVSEQKFKDMVKKWKNHSDVQIDRHFVSEIIQYIEKAIMIGHQLNELTGKSVPQFSIFSDICDQLNLSTLSVVYVRESFVKFDLKRAVLSVVEFYQTQPVRDLFSQSGSLFDQLVSEGQRLCSEVEEAKFSKFEIDSTLPDVGLNFDELSMNLFAVLDFTIFLHEEGLCSREPQEEDSNKKEGSTEWCDGTGLGDGDGVNDKSDEIEDAGQFDTDRNEHKGDKGDDDNDKDDDLDKGIDANADQGMNEDDVEEHNVPRDEKQDENDEEKDDDQDREMGDVDMNDGGEIDESGAPPSDDEEEKDNEGNNKEEEIELKNNANSSGEKSEENRHLEDNKKSGDNQSGDDEEEEEENKEEDGNEGEETDSVAGEKHEGFIDPKDKMDEEGDANSENELNEDDLVSDVDEDDGNSDEEEKPGSVKDVLEDDDESIPPIDETSGEKNEESAEEPAPEDTEADQASGQNIDSSPSREDPFSHDAPSEQPASENQNKTQENPSSGSADNQVSMDTSSGGDRVTNQAPSTKPDKKKCPPAPSPLEPNSSDALDEWLKEIKEVVEKSKREDSLPQLDQGDVGEKEDTSDKTAIAKASEAVAGTVNEDTEEEAGDASSKDRKDESAIEDGIDQENVVMRDVVENDEMDSPQEEDSNCDESMEPEKSQDDRKSTGRNLTAVQDYDESVSIERIDDPIENHTLEKSSEVLTKNEDEEAAITNLQECEMKATRLASDLSDKLMAVLEPTKRGRLEGYFKTGKRVSMRRVLSWIASDYRRDKFWLRRSKPSNRDYRVVICLDNTLSMKTNGVGELSLICVSAISQSLQLIQVGKVGVLSFGTDVKEICPLEDTSSGIRGTVSDLMKDFKFNEESTNSFSEAFPRVVHKCSEAFKASEASSSDSSGGSLALIITDGRFDKEKCRPYVQELISQGHVPVLIVMDANRDESILSVTSVSFEEEPGTKRRKILRRPFLSQTDCPFPFYAVIQDPTQLPTTLADILRQWIEISSR